jgi:methylenetetrahydrofolate dehydrogenase (NADP+)/methenyltetrahydrofolate cyclohydrolase
MKLLGGKLLAQEMYKKLSQEIDLLKKNKIKPVLAVILVGDDPSSRMYVARKTKQAKALGIAIDLHELPKTVTTQRILSTIDQLNYLPNVTGILVQLPLPHHIDTHKILWRIDRKKDVDGFQMRDFRPPAPMAIIDLLAHYNIPLLKKKVTIVGYGMLVGRPLTDLLRKQCPDITICDSSTQDLEEKVRQADIVISGVGKAGLITKEMVRPGQIVIDAGTSSESGLTKGDVAFDEVAPIVEAITPVPGGIGPLTIAELFKNVVKAAATELKSPVSLPSEPKSPSGLWGGPLIQRIED